MSSNKDGICLLASILMIAIALIFFIGVITTIRDEIKEIEPILIPDYSKSLESLEQQLEGTKLKLESLKVKVRSIEARMDELLKVFEMSSIDTYTVTAYAPLDPKAVYGLDYIGNPAVTASGDRPIPGQTVAADKSLPFGTKVWIEGIGVRTVNDRGGAIKRGRLDLCMATKSEAIHFGRQRRKVIILKEGQK